MSKKVEPVRSSKRRKLSHLSRLAIGLPVVSGLVLAVTPAAHAFQAYDGSLHGNNLEITLDITTSYTGQWRVQRPSAVLMSTANANGNEGDINFRSGLVGSTFEVLPVLDIRDNTFGMHFSGEYFLNTVYLGTNQNNQPGTINPVVPKNDDFASETRQANGSNGRMLDAFVYNSWDFGDGQSISVKAGQQTLFWGQSLYYGTNGIAGGQAPIDVVSASQLVNPQSQQIFLPVGQVVLTYQPNSTYTIQGYYQYQWEPYALNGVGSYFSTSDVTGPGGQRIIAISLGGQNYYLINNKAITPPSQNGQFGLSGQAQWGNYDVGLFGLRYDAKTPNVYQIVNAAHPVATPGGVGIGLYRLVYPRDIWLYGTSLSTTIGATNVAGELSMRTHMPLVAGTNAGAQSVDNMGNANNDPLYPVGNTMTGLASFIYGSPALPFDPGGITVTGEAEYVDVFRVTANKAFLAPGRSDAAASFDLSVSPAYFNVLPKLELQFPMSVKYNFAGNSRMDTTMNHGTGNYAFGVTATYALTWIASLNYVGYFGKVGTSALAPEVSTSVDRGYASFNVQHTF